MKNRALIPVFCYIFISFLSFSAEARMYKWVDEEGNTHYTQSPPPGDIEPETLKLPADIDPAISEKSFEKYKKEFESGSKDPKAEEKAAEDEGVSDEEYERQVKQACDSARKMYQSYQRNRVNVQNADGSMRSLGEEERQEGIKKAEAAIAKYCK